LEWDHKIEVSGPVKKEGSVSMKNIADLEKVVLAVTVACDGNRRKELNALKRTNGFDWSAGAVSTAVWGGARFSDVVKLCGGAKPEAEYVTFEGADIDLGHGVYGACYPISMLMDQAANVLLAYEINGAKLTPDHGFPCRLIVPGQVCERNDHMLHEVLVV
jgi:nitrate reductase (NAD(P)H)